jgi:hypothetical protein
MNDPLAEGNIQLKIFQMVVKEAYIADGAEVFKDEHGIQWIKFFPKNGQDSSKEHMLRTDRILIVRIS